MLLMLILVYNGFHYTDLMLFTWCSYV